MGNGRRAIVIVLDSVGAGELPDAAAYGDVGANTLGNLAAALPEGLALPNLARLGLGRITAMKGVPATDKPGASFGRLAEASAGKDTTTGHWEMAGIVLKQPFPVYPHGFPPEVMEPFEQAVGRKTLGNYAASGTEIIKELGAEHLRTGEPIVYTSADSVFQIAAHEEVIPVAELYHVCEIARGILQGVHGVGRVIARPFLGRPGDFHRTENRRDFSLEPPEETFLDRLKTAGRQVFGVGKIVDIFAGRGLTGYNHTGNNGAGLAETLRWLQEGEDFLFTNLVDFDMVYGHRRDVPGYAAALRDFDAFIPAALGRLRPEDLVIVTADHGCDPTFKGTDHTREYAPLLCFGPKVADGVDLGVRPTFADIGQTVSEWLGAPLGPVGKSFVGLVRT